MSKPHDLTYIADIQDAGSLAVEFLDGVTREQFEKDLLRQSGVMYRIAIIGEAAGKISLALRQSHPEIPWNKMSGMRNVLVHAYREADVDTVWDTVKNDLPSLLLQIKMLLP